MVSKRDSLAFQFEKAKVQAIVKDIYSLDHADIVAKYPLSSWDSRDGKVEYVKSSVLSAGLGDSNYIKCLYRPFDDRWTYYTPKSKGFLAWPVHEVMQHMLNGKNLGLISCRQMSQFDEEWALVGSTRLPIECCTISNKTKEINYLFPLWRYQGAQKISNLSSSFAMAIQSAFNLGSMTFQVELDFTYIS